MKSYAPASKRFNRVRAFAPPSLALLLACGCAAVYVVRALRAERQVLLVNRDGTRGLMDLGRLGEARLTNPRTGAREEFGCKSRRCLLIFFSPADCSSCVGEVGRWQELSRRFEPERLQVRGFLVRTSWDEAQAFLRDYSPSVELSLDADDEIEKLAGLPHKTPFKVLTDGEGRVLMVDGPNSTQGEQASFVGRVAARVAE
jgi:peroxiredoxin